MMPHESRIQISLSSSLNKIHKNSQENIDKEKGGPCSNRY